MKYRLKFQVAMNDVFLVSTSTINVQLKKSVGGSGLDYVILVVTGGLGLCYG